MPASNELSPSPDNPISPDTIYVLGNTPIEQVGIKYEGKLVTSKFLREHPESRDMILRATTNAYGAPVFAIPADEYKAIMARISL